ncbi:flagellar protein [Tardiphaga sp. vice352]|uniref:flagellin N-terminal helical domain-containing protein n=1 Tax=Tardiphaga sp. vice352 TaxID=2592816 RepID=UPI001165800F|nr:flagellin [Tardiphaga sp. vice352]QDM33257.1 flagellar protein [Tardiphaga sp. vice352]
MSGITLTSAVRQNLLSLQSTASLLSETQNRLSTGNKVNSALDNPTNFFTASSLHSRSSDINNLLDGIGNGVQILQAANTGITSIQKLVDSAKSIANQALQTTVGYTKSSITSLATTGATASNLLGPSGAPTTAAFTGAAAVNNLTTPGTLTGATKLSGGANSDSLTTSFAANDTLTVNGQTLTFKASGASGANEINITDDVTALLGKIDGLTGATGSTVTAGKLVINTGTASDLTITSSAAAPLAALGLSTGVTQARTAGSAPALQGKVLTIGATGGGTASSITFGTSAGQVDTLDKLNTALSTNNLQASIDTTGKLTITTTNDAASANIGTVGGTASTTSTVGFNGQTVANAVKDPTSQATRASLIAQYNQVIDQIETTAKDSSFNGVNLLNNDTLKLTFNETGTSKLSISGVSFGPGGLGLSKLTAGTDFTDNAAANKTLASLTTASTTLRSQASSFGSNLSVVQIRQDFSKSLINVLQTGASNLTLADTNEEAANSQALSTRQSIAVSALSLANTAQQGVLQLLR